MNKEKCKDCGYAIIIEGRHSICGFKKLNEYITDTYYAPNGTYFIDIDDFGCTFWESIDGFDENKRHIPKWMKIDINEE